MGHADHEISEAFSMFDRDGNQILDEEEQKRMKSDLEEKRVGERPQEGGGGWVRDASLRRLSMSSAQDALSDEINNLGVNYGKDSSAGGSEKRKSWSQTFVDREQFLRWEKFSGC